MSICRKRILWGAAATALLWGSQATAQDRTTRVDELVVTAQKREETVQDAPAAISAFGPEAIAARDLRTVQDLQYETQSFQAGTGFSTTAVFLRGVGQTVGQPGVAIHVDGVYQARVFQTALSQVDLARIEVLRGPQGTLYGRNAAAGAVNFISNAPTRAFEGYGLAGFGAYATAHLQGVVNAPLTERLRTRVAFDLVDQGEGYIKNVVPGNPNLGALRTLSGRLRAQYDITDEATLDLIVSGMTQDGAADYLLLRNAPNAGAIARNPYLANVITPFEPWRTSANHKSGRSADAYSVVAALTAKLPGDLAFKSTSGLTYYSYANHYDADGSQLDIFVLTNRFKAQTFTQEFTLSGRRDAVEWLAGAYFLDDKHQSFAEFSFPMGFAQTAGSPVGLLRNANLDIVTAPYNTQSWAVFADGTFHASDRVRIMAGARYTEEDQDRVGWNLAGPLGIIPTNTVLAPVSAACVACYSEAKFFAFTPRLGVQFDLDEDTSLYGLVSKGFKSGGINAPANGPDATPYRPEKLLAYEVGLKTRLFDRRLTFNATAFYYDYADFQLNQYIGLQAAITNASAATVKGLEFETAWTPDAHWALNANLSLLDATYDAFLNIDGLDPAQGVQDLSGARLNYSPKASGNVGVRYRTDMTASGRLTARADVYMSSSFYFREFNTPLGGQPAYGKLDLALIWDNPAETLRARAYVNNVTQEAYVSVLGTSDNFGAAYINWAPPRTFGLELAAKF